MGLRFGVLLAEAHAGLAAKGLSNPMRNGFDEHVENRLLHALGYTGARGRTFDLRK